ncbi:hypothetical protein [Sedimenticola selenatireducens]|uniref:Uncharacterized protein n=1 Tax=Sedimenticola selenatireducens TaxID=191960 RepID=A0A557S217_9GAMM|nr:hypothetical protein [Sedimenticola selenatireducens]TVO71463.1 hypothetical protein FHP88_14175 [Sedimenticola selenatireducens]TVT66152.1 MAG: hypothetical protein FHK78_02610 [Sedimenticola selenatireducens]
MAQSINHFDCPVCNTQIASWVVRRPVFTCTACGQAFTSNYRRSLKRSALLGLLLWIGGALAGILFIDPWQMVLAFSLEFGGLIAFLFAYLVHHFSIRIDINNETSSIE